LIKFLNKLKPKKGEKKEEKKEDKKQEAPKESPPPAPLPSSSPEPAPSQPGNQPFPMFPFPYYQPPQSNSSEIENKKQIMEFEKIKASVETFKEAKRDMDDKLRSFAESLGEVRSMFLQREQSIRDMQTKIEGMSEVVESLDPDKVTEERRKREKEMALLTAKIERMDKVTTDLLERFAEVRETLEGLKSLKAIVDTARNIGEKLLEIEQTKNSMERMSSKLETTYLEMNKHLADLPLTKSKTEALEDLTKEMMKMIDDLKVNIDKAATKEDLAGVKPVIAEIPKKDEMLELEERRNEMKQLMATLDKEFKESAISEKSYKDSMDKSKQKLEDIEKKIDALKSAKSGGFSKLFGAFGFGKKKQPPKKPKAEAQEEEDNGEESEEAEAPQEEGIISQAMEVVPEEAEAVPEEDEEKKEGETARKELITKIKKKEIDQVVKPKKAETKLQAQQPSKGSQQPSNGSQQPSKGAQSQSEIPPSKTVGYQSRADKSEKPKLEKKLKKVVQMKKEEEEKSVTPNQAREDLMKKLKLR
jgi:hypothetical protein